MDLETEAKLRLLNYEDPRAHLLTLYGNVVKTQKIKVNILCRILTGVNDPLCHNFTHSTIQCSTLSSLCILCTLDITHH